MIKLIKLDRPSVLVEYGEYWTNTILELLNNNIEIPLNLKNKYNHAEIKDTLVAETRGKCAYCESKIRHISPGDIEHVVPKSEEPALWFHWENLTLACSNCNNSKRARQGLVDPYDDQPSEHFWFVGDVILAALGSDKGRLTEIILKLNRIELVERRRNRLLFVRSLMENIVKEPNLILKAVLVEDLVENELNDSAEYAAMCREFVRVAVEKGYFPAF